MRAAISASFFRFALVESRVHDSKAKRLLPGTASLKSSSRFPVNWGARKGQPRNIAAWM